MTEIPPLPPGAARDPPPGLPQAPIASVKELKVGDVIQIAVHREDRLHGGHYWWKRFAVVMAIHRHEFDALNLKMRPNLEPFVKGSDLNVGMNLSVSPWNEPQVVTKIVEPWPQGVAAMYMKLLAQRIIRQGDE